MGSDVPLACLSDRPQQLSATSSSSSAGDQSADRPIREELVMSLISYIGRSATFWNEAPENCHTLKIPHPILTNRNWRSCGGYPRVTCWRPRYRRSSGARMARPG